MKRMGLFLGCVAALALILGGCTTMEGDKDHTVVFGKRLPRPSMPELRKKVDVEIRSLLADAKRHGKFNIPITISDRVIYFIAFWQGRASKHMRRYLERSGKYLTMMRSILKQYGIPTDLVYMALIESGFNCRARSWASAVGPWQFIRRTGIRFGLRVGRFIDERRDPVKSTHAAAQYMTYLYNLLGSWYLVAAAYNGGEGTILGALRAYEAKTFWEIARPDRRYLAQETKDYVPKLIAAALIAKEPHKYGFGDVKFQDQFAFELVKVRGGLDLEVVAKLCGVDPYDVFDLNPHLRRGVTPPWEQSFEIRIPKGKKQSFLVAYADHVKKNPRPVMVARSGALRGRGVRGSRGSRGGHYRLATHRIRPGDSLWKLARRYGVSTKALLKINGLRSGRRLRPGQVVHIPSYAPRRFARRARGLNRARRFSGRRNYVVADAGYSTRSVRRGRRMRSGDTGRGASRRGGKLRVIKYTFKAGDTLWILSRRHGVHWKDILRWNGIRNHRYIRPGRKLEIYVSGASKGRSTRTVAAGVSPKSKKGVKPASKPGRAKSGDISGTGRIATMVREGYLKEEIRYRVRKGENLWTIARRYNLRVKQIREWNNLQPGQVIYPGDKLVLRIKKK